MKSVKVRGFSRDNTGRMLRRDGMDRFGCPGYVQENVEMPCKIQFGKVLMRFDETLQNRPYLQFVEGQMQGVTVDLREMPDMPWDEAQVEFDTRSMPEVNVRWDLSNREIAGLVGKGLFGFDYDIDHKDGVQPKPERRGPIEMPPVFTAAPIEMNMNCEVRALAAPSDGKVVPVIGVYPKNALDMRTNTRIMGYENMDEFFAKPTFLEPDEYEASKEMDVVYLNEDEMLFGKKQQPSPAETDKEQAEPVKAPEEKVYVTDSMMEQTLSMVEDNRAAVSLAQSGNKLDDMVKQADESFESELEAWLQEEAKQASAEKPAEPVNKKPFIPAESYGEQADREASYLEEADHDESEEYEGAFLD